MFRFVARFARGRIEDSSFNRFALNGIQSGFFGGIFSGGIFVGWILSGYPIQHKEEKIVTSRVHKITIQHKEEKKIVTSPHIRYTYISCPHSTLCFSLNKPRYTYLQLDTCLIIPF